MFLITSTSLLVTAVLTAVMVIVYKKRKTIEEEKPDYRGKIALGLLFFALGIAHLVVDDFIFFGWFGVGVLYLIVGFRNKKKWKNKE